MSIRKRPGFRRSRVLLATLLLPLMTPLARCGNVTVVDPHGGPGGGLLQAAIASASPGDILVLEAGDYSAGLSGDRIALTDAITIVRDTDAGEIILPPVGTDLFSEPIAVTLRGVQVEPVAGHHYDSLYATFNVPGAWIEDCTLVGQDVFRDETGHWTGGSSGLRAYRWNFVIGCTITGGNGCDADPTAADNQPSSGDAAITFSPHTMDIDAVVVADSTVLGGHVGSGAATSYHPAGGSGVDLWNMEGAYISGSLVAGGDTAPGNDPLTKPGSGISGFVYMDNPVATLRDSSIHAGKVVEQGTPVPDIAMPPGTVFTFPAAQRSCKFSAPARAGSPVTLTLRGRPGDVVLLLVQQQFASPYWWPQWPGSELQGSFAFYPPESTVLSPLVITNPAGIQELAFRMPEVPQALGEGTTLFIQGVFAGDDGVTVGAPTSVIWISASS